mmetsp:Transcript_2815/g.6743  ORF Transcript_2815/g.6743 Transcript_2815/m.6743 type:complete len:95 (-) Transcript_2815:194-478(-)
MESIHGFSREQENKPMSSSWSSLLQTPGRALLGTLLTVDELQLFTSHHTLVPWSPDQTTPGVVRYRESRLHCCSSNTVLSHFSTTTTIEACDEQ